MLKGILTASISAICYASGVVFVRWAYAAGMNPPTGIFLRFFLGSLLLGAGLWLFSRRSGRPAAAVLGLKRRRLFLMGFFLYTIMGISWFTALQTSLAWLVSLFTAIYPLTIGLGAWMILREPFHPVLLPALGAVVVGGLLLFWQSGDPAGALNQAALAGAMLMLVNVAAYTTFVLLGRSLVHPEAPEASVFWILSGAALGSGLYALLRGDLSFNFAPQGWVWVLAFSLITTVLSTVFLWRGIRLLGPARAAIVGAFEPLFGILFSLLVLGERLAPLQVAGGALVLAGVGWLHWSGQKS